MVQFSSFWKAVWILIIMTVVDAVTGMVIEPRLMGQGLGLSPLGILLALFFMGWLWGIPGMILAVPIMAVTKIICSNVPSLRFLEALLSD
jgi:AI-2 transport protein TqsA